MSIVPPKFALIEPDHKYLLDGQEMPGATGILKANGVIDDKWFNEAARDRGRAVHKACHFLAEGDLNWDAMTDELRGYVEAYEKAVEAIDFMPIKCETPIYHPVYFYGTTPDQIGIIGSMVNRTDPGLVELKTGTMQKWTSLQTAFQAMAEWPGDYFRAKRFGIEIHADGTFKAEEFINMDDFDVAVGMIAAYKWKLQNGGF